MQFLKLLILLAISIPLHHCDIQITDIFKSGTDVTLAVFDVAIKTLTTPTKLVDLLESSFRNAQGYPIALATDAINALCQCLI